MDIIPISKMHPDERIPQIITHIRDAMLCIMSQIDRTMNMILFPQYHGLLLFCKTDEVDALYHSNDLVYDKR
jgi:hypothetical protein